MKPLDEQVEELSSATAETVANHKRFIAALWTKVFGSKSINEAEYEVGITDTLIPDPE